MTHMTEPNDLSVAGLRARANAIHIAVDATVAEDLDAALRWAAARIEEYDRQKKGPSPKAESPFS